MATTTLSSEDSLQACDISKEGVLSPTSVAHLAVTAFPLQSKQRTARRCWDATISRPQDRGAGRARTLNQALKSASGALLSAILCVGCAHSVKELARESSRAAVDESVNQLTQEDAKQQIANAMSDPRVEETVKNVTDQVAEGVLRALESPRAQQQLQTIASTATRAVTQQMLATLASPATREQVEQLTRGLTSSALDDLGTRLHDNFVPGLRDALARDLADGAASALKNDQLHNALAASAQNVAYNATVGVSDGLRSSWSGDPGNALRGVARSAAPWLRLFFWGLVLTAFTVFCAAVIVIARAFRARTEVRRLETATLLLATAMRERHETKDTDEIVSVVRDALEKSANDHQRHGLLGFLRLRHH